MRDDRTITFNGTTYNINSIPDLGSITGGITGSGTSNYGTIFTSSGSIGNAWFYQTQISSLNHVVFPERVHFQQNIAIQYDATVYGNNGLIACESVGYIPASNLVFQVASTTKGSKPFP
ncbi:hypothetical protein IEE83_13110 [Dyadobacter sp. UP-52]|uniref:Uncharacterized protein n=2 Tax=Dyadobacter subterraneus TaxID=2773304 RepID=A0ABR9WCC2_9BACT|nr:hypothetical protein [Dyadobacter subterraneus]